MALFGLIGFPLEHSFSKAFFEAKFQREMLPHHFELFPIREVRLFQSLIRDHNSLRGLAVTIPYKQSIMHYLDALDESAKAIGAVNCISIGEHLKGYNTDCIGFEQSLKPLLHSDITHALVLGTGGAAAAVKYVLKKCGIEIFQVSRRAMKGCVTYEDIDQHTLEQCKLIVNCTPLGMYPLLNSCPNIPYQFLTPKHLVYDLVYNPDHTMMLQMAKEKGAVTKNGLEMLHLQAEANWEIWQRGL